MTRNYRVLPLKYDSVRNDLFVEFEVNQIYELRISTDFQEFELGFPDGSKIIDITQHIKNHEKTIRSHENSLYDIINSTLRSHKLRIDMKEDWKSLELPFEGHRYRLELNPYTGQLKLFMPEYIMIADRDKLTDSFPELQKMEYGTIQSILIDQIIDVQPVFITPGDSGLSPRSTLPVQIVRPKEFLIGEYYYRIQYLMERDACYIHVPDRLIKTHVRGITRDIPELEDLHGGKLIDTIVNEVNEFGLQVSR